MDKPFALYRMTRRSWLSWGGRVLLVSTVVAMACSACLRSLPEWTPMKDAPPAPGKAWKPRLDQLSSPLPAEQLPGLPPTLEPFADKLSLPQFIDAALQTSPTTRQAWEQARAAAAAWAQARGGYYPTIGANLYGFRTEGGPSAGATDFAETIGQGELTLSYLLLDFGGRSAQAEAARQALFNANWNHDQAIQDVLRNVAQAYHNHLGARAQMQADEVSLAEAQKSLQAAEERRRAGVGTLADVLQAQATEAQVRVALESDRGAVEISRGQLATAVGWPANIPFGVAEGPEELPLDAIGQNVEELIARAQRNRPDLAAVRAFVQQREAELRQSDSALWPQLLANGNVGHEIVRGGFDTENSYYQVGLQLQIPLFQGFTLYNAVRGARARLEAAHAALQLQMQTVVSDVWAAYYNFRTAARQLEASRTLLASSTQAFQASTARFRAGAGDIVELLNAQSQLARARAQQVQAQTSLFTSYAELVHAIGAELPAADSEMESGTTGARGYPQHGKP
jgi:outer membrane protein